jgi:hypothetical protein
MPHLLTRDWRCPGFFSSALGPVPRSAFEKCELRRAKTGRERSRNVIKGLGDRNMRRKSAVVGGMFHAKGSTVEERKTAGREGFGATNPKSVPENKAGMSFRLSQLVTVYGTDPDCPESQAGERLDVFAGFDNCRAGRYPWELAMQASTVLSKAPEGEYRRSLGTRTAHCVSQGAGGNGDS